MDELRKEETRYTTADIYALPDGKRAELIDGKIYDMAPPGLIHQRISMKLSRELSAFTEKNGGSCEVLAAPFAVFLTDDDRTYVEPDISVICDRTKLDEKGCHGAPDWIIEIVSPNSRSKDYMTKLFLYRTAGVREYWIVDPDQQITSVYSFETDRVEQYRFDEKVVAGVWEGFCVRVV